MKRYFALFLTFILIFNFVSFSYADTIDNLITVDPGNTTISSGNSTSNPAESELTTNSPESSSKGWGILSFIIDIINDFFTILSNYTYSLVFLIPTIDNCIFNTGTNNFRLSIFDNNPTGISYALQGYISAVYNAFRYLTTAVYIIVLVYLALKMMLSSVGRQKARYKELFRHWLIGLLILFSFHWVMAFTVWLCNTLVSVLYEFSKEIIIDTILPNKLAQLLDGGLTELSPITKFIISRAACIGIEFVGLLAVLYPIFTIICSVIIIAQAFSIILTYLKRLFTVMILIITFPLVAMSYVFDKIGDRKAQTFELWLKEFIVNVMIQPIHALTLVLLSVLFVAGSNTLFSTSTLGGIMALISLRLIPMGEEFLKKLFQIGSNMGPGSHGISGSMARAGMAFQGAKNIAGNFASKGKLAKDLYSHHMTKKDFAAAYAKDPKKYKEKVENLDKAFRKDHGGKSVESLKKSALLGAGGAAFAVGSSLTGASSGHFLSEAATKTAAYSSAAASLAFVPDNIRKLKNGDEERAEKLGYKEAADKLSNVNSSTDQKTTADLAIKLHNEFGIDKTYAESVLRNPNTTANKKQIEEWKDSLTYAHIRAKHSPDKKTEDIIKETVTWQRNQRVREGKDPYTGEPIDLSQYTEERTNDSTLLRSKATGAAFTKSDKGSNIVKPGEIYSNSASKGNSINSELQISEKEQAKASAELQVETAKEERKAAIKEADKAARIKEQSTTTLEQATTTWNGFDSSTQASVLSKWNDITRLESEMERFDDRNDPEYKKLKKEHDTLKTQFANTRSGEAYINYTNAQNDFNSANERYDAAVERKNNAIDNYDTAAKTYSQAKSSFDSAVSERKERLAIDANFAAAGGTPVYSETALDMVTNGSVSNAKVHVEQQKVWVDIGDTSYAGITLENLSPDTVFDINESTIQNARNVIKNNVISNTGTSPEDLSSEQYASAVQDYISNPTSFNGSADVQNVFSALSSLGNSSGANKASYNPFSIFEMPTELPECFSYGVCPELNNYLEANNAGNGIEISLTYIASNEFSVSIINGRNTSSQNISTSVDVVSKIFPNGTTDSPVVIVSRDGNWYKK